MSVGKRLYTNDPSIPGIPEDWPTWPSVLKAGFPIMKVCPHVWNEIYLYSNENDRYGFLTRSKILTRPVFAKHYRVIDDEKGLVTIVSAKSGMNPNSWVLVDLKNCKEIHSNFAAYFFLDKTQLAYRVDDTNCAWPTNMQWGVFDLVSEQVIMQPTSLPFENLTDKYVPVRDRILSHMAANA